MIRSLSRPQMNSSSAWRKPRSPVRRYFFSGSAASVNLPLIFLGFPVPASFTRRVNPNLTNFVFPKMFQLLTPCVASTASTATITTSTGAISTRLRKGYPHPTIVCTIVYSATASLLAPPAVCRCTRFFRMQATPSFDLHFINLSAFLSTRYLPVITIRRCLRDVSWKNHTIIEAKGRKIECAEVLLHNGFCRINCDGCKTDRGTRLL